MTEIALAFDQNMRAHVAFVQSGLAWLWWYDSQVNQMAFTSFPGMSNPRLATDEKRDAELAVSDVVLSYMSGGNLCCRIQRERFTVERVLTAAPVCSWCRWPETPAIGCSGVLPDRLTRAGRVEPSSALPLQATWIRRSSRCSAVCSLRG